MKKKVTISLESEVWKSYQIICLKQGVKPSHEIQKFMESELDGS